MAVKDSIGGWKDNAIFFKKAKACSTAKHYIGDSWIQFLKGHGINNVIDCPIPAVRIYVQIFYVHIFIRDVSMFKLRSFQNTKSFQFSYKYVTFFSQFGRLTVY